MSFEAAALDLPFASFVTMARRFSLLFEPQFYQPGGLLHLLQNEVCPTELEMKFCYFFLVLSFSPWFRYCQLKGLKYWEIKGVKWTKESIKSNSWE